MAKRFRRPKVKPLTVSVAILTLAVVAVLLALAGTGLIGDASSMIVQLLKLAAVVTLGIELGLVAVLLRKKKLDAMTSVFGIATVLLAISLVADLLGFALPALLISLQPWVIVVVAVGILIHFYQK